MVFGVHRDSVIKTSNLKFTDVLYILEDRLDIPIIYLTTF